MTDPRRPTRPRLDAHTCRGSLAGLGLLLLAGCGGDGGGTPTDPDPEPAPTTGTLEVSAATTGDTLDADGYTVTLDGGDERALDRDGTVVFEDLDEGDHEVALGGVQVNCAPDGGTSRTVSVTAGETAAAAFDVACAPALFDRIVFDSNRTGQFELFVMETDGANPTALGGGEPGSNAADPSVSPDGTRVLFRSDRTGNLDVFTMTADGSDVVKLTEDPAGDFDPAWSPDGERIVFASDRAGGNLDIYVMDADGSGVTRLTDDPANDVDPAWSPDGERIAFRSHRGDGGDADIWIMNADGTGLTALTDDPGADDAPAWTPDGERIAFRSDREDGSPDIWVMNADGTGLLRVTGDAGPNLLPDVDPDGERIAFLSSRDGDFEVFTIGADGSGPVVNLTANAASDFRPAWTPTRVQR